MNLYLVILMRRPQVDPAVVTLHQQFLADLRAQGRNALTGPFSDNSGGAYLLRAASMEEATEIVHRDPAYTSGGWDVTFYEWHAR
jgi:uncharacterized protein YciI